ncbi:MAG TPA: GNAT family protein [Planctomycetota bacterium]|nr:GNAT family protein [Planctomycetota bacterium]
MTARPPPNPPPGVHPVRAVGALCGERVDLVPLDVTHRAEFTARAVASRQLHAPWASAPETAETFDQLLARQTASFESHVVRLATDKSLVGAFHLSQIFLGNFCSAYLGYYALAPFEGRGLMTEGMHLVLHHAFLRVGLHRLEANIQPGNTRSLALAKRCGFEREGFSPGYLRIGGAWRDHERWAIRREAWTPDPAVLAQLDGSAPS